MKGGIVIIKANLICPKCGMVLENISFDNDVARMKCECGNVYRLDEWHVKGVTLIKEGGII